ncbi:MAG: chemotaxis protein CheA [Phycisphaerae bacterium]
MPEPTINIQDQIKDLIGNLADLSGKITCSDLGELAQIHEGCLKIEQAAQDLPKALSKGIGEFCQQAREITEQIIMESRTDLLTAMKSLCDAIRQLHQATQSLEALPEAKVFYECAALLTEGAVSPDPLPAEETKLNGDTEPEPSTPEIPEFVKAEDIEEYHQEPLVIAEQELEYITDFLTEGREHIGNVETGLLVLEQTPNDPDKINEVFRSFHTIKGMAGFLNLRDVQALTHRVETLMDLGRKGKLQITANIIDVIFEALDVLKVQINEIAGYVAKPFQGPIPQPPIQNILTRVALATQGKTPAPRSAESGKASGKKYLGDILVEDGKVAPDLRDFGLQQQKKMDNKPIGQTLISMGTVSARDVSQSLRKQNADVQETVVRVDTDKLDELVNLVGELVITQTQVEQYNKKRDNAEVNRLTDQVSKIVRDVQEAAMSMRMVTLSQTFHKMGRLVRDLARKVDKKINFEVEGEDTELDKNMIQELSDPLMHMVRNAVDHGIETPAERVEAGKPECGTLTLCAHHQGGNILLEISDDGKGLDKDALIRKAIEKGMLSPDATLSESQAFNLIMAAGFSTAEKVTDISGRGVGMDVVRKNLENLRGKVDIRSIKGKGTTFTIRLPLTLAVIDGMIVRVGSQKYVLPTLSIVQALSINREQLTTIQDRWHILNQRGKLYTLISLGELFRVDDALKDPTQGIVVLAQAQDQQVGLILDEILGQQQVVIKTLGEGFKNMKGITGGAILGDGTIGLILEPEGLLEAFQHHKDDSIKSV